MSSDPVPTDPKPVPAWRNSLALTVLGLIIAGPLALPLLWANRRIPLLVKIGVTIIIIAAAVYTFKLMIEIYRRLESELAKLNSAL